MMPVWLSLLTVQAALPSASLAAGFANVSRTPGELLSGLNAPEQGRTAIIAYHNGILFTVPEVPSSQPGADFQVRTWNIADPANPVELAQHGTTRMPVNAHGYFKSGDYLVLGGNGSTPWSFRDTGVFGQLSRTNFPNLIGVWSRGQLYQPWQIYPTYWSYGEVGGNAEIHNRNGFQASWDHLGLTGVIGHPIMVGNLLIFASDQSRTGIATYDISDPTNPVLLDVLKTGGPGGYWPEIWGGDGKLYIVFPYRTNGNGFRVVDVTDPTDLRFLADKPLPGAACMYIQFQDEYAFMGGHKVDMRTFESVLFLDGANVVRTSDGGTGIDTSQHLLPVGNLLITGGIGPNEGMAIWAHQAAPDTCGPSVGYHIPRAGQTSYPITAPISLLIHETLETPTLSNGYSFIVRPLGGSPIDGTLIFAFDDTLTFTPSNNLLPDTTYEVIVPAGRIQDVAGNGIEGYAFTFSTGSTNAGNRPPVITTFAATPTPVAPSSMVSFTATATDPEEDPILYRFEFGDGTAKTAWSASSNVQHVYTNAGHYTAKVQCSDTSAVIVTRAMTVTVTVPPTGPTPTHSSPIACHDTQRRLYAVNPDNNTITCLDADTLAVQYEVSVGADPRALALDQASNLWVTCHDADLIDILRSADGSRLDSIQTGYGSAPFGMAFSPSGNTAYVSMYGGGELRAYDAPTRTEVGRAALGPTPRAIAVSGDGSRILVTRFLSHRDDGEVWDIDASTFTLTRTLRIPKFGGTANRDTTASGRGTANYLAGIVLSPDSSQAWIASTKANAERGLFFHDDLDQDNSVRNIISRIDLTSGQFVDAIDMDNSDSATALAYSPLGDYLFVTLQGNNELIVLDMLKAEGSVGLGAFVTRVDVGLAPQGVCMDPTAQRAITKDFMDRSVTALDLAAFFATGDITLPSTNASTVANESLAAEVLLGKQIFYNASDPRMSAEGYLSCATCHVDGGHDGRVWDFTGRGEGFRNTTTLRGRSGTAQGNVHWTANFDEIQDFENDIRGAFGGRGFLSDADFATTSDPLGVPKAGREPDLDALAAYVTSLAPSTVPRSPHRMTNGWMTMDALMGKAIAQQLNCAACHSGSTLTDSSSGTVTLHNVGTLRTTSGNRRGQTLTGIDTPTLKGLWNTAPYLHDGSAATLEEVFRVAGGTIYQAEHATASAGAQIVTNWVHLNNDDTAHNRGLASLNTTGALLTFSNVDGGTGGVAALEIRYSKSGGADLIVRINGSTTNVALATLPNNPGWRHTYWTSVRLDHIHLNAGSNNTIELTTDYTWPNISIDDLLVTTSSDLALAIPHRQALTLSQTDLERLIAYLLQLDGQPENPDAPSTYSAWVDQQGLMGTNASADANSDADGTLNLGEYAFDTNPAIPDEGGSLTPNVTMAGSDRVYDITYRRATYALDMIPALEQSSDLDTWNEVPLDGGDVTETVVDPDIDGDDTAELVRLRITMPTSTNWLHFRIQVRQRGN